MNLPSWEEVELINDGLCSNGRYQSGKTSDGYEAAKDCWARKSNQVQSIKQVADLCKECHQLAPFLFLNGNTFTTVARYALTDYVKLLTPIQATMLRSAVGHYVAGTTNLKELDLVIHSITQKPETPNRSSEQAGINRII